jgi:retinol-binding protein 3
MRMLMWLVLAFVVSTLVAACATGPTQGSVAITTQIDFSGETPHGSFDVTEGADVLGCSGGTFVDNQTADSLHKEFTCESGTKSGTFTAEFSPPSGPWKIVDSTDDFSGLSGEGDFSLAPASETSAETAAPSLDEETRASVIDDLLGQLQEKYVFVDVAEKMEKAVRERQSKGEYDGITDRTSFAQALTDHLREVSHDGHLEVLPSAMMGPPTGVETFTGEIQTESEDPKEIDENDSPPPTASAEGDSASLYRTEHLSDDVGYIELPGFPPPESGAGAAAASAMNELNDTSALIFDLRENHGGAPEMVALMCSYLFGPDPVHLNDMHWRKGDNFEIQEFWTQPQQVDGERYGEDKPIYVLTSHDTFSGGEEFTYDLQALGRATIVGETTGGGANPNDSFQLAADFTVLIPIGAPVNPVTKTNWEGTGVKPDIDVPKVKALETAQDMALEKAN